MINDVSKGGRPQRGIMIVVACADGRHRPRRSELTRRVTAMADYVLHVADAAAGDEALDFLVGVASAGGQQSLRDVLDDVADREGAHRGTKRSAA